MFTSRALVTLRETPQLWRLPALAGALALALARAGSPFWMAVLCLPVIGSALSGLMFEREVTERWFDRGYFLLADGAIVALVLLGIPATPPLLFVGFFGVAAICVLCGTRQRAWFAAAALIAALVAAVAGLESLVGVRAAAALSSLDYVLLSSSALSFGVIGERMSQPPVAIAVGREEARELGSLLQISDAIGSTLDVAQVMRSIVQQVGNLVGTDSCSILLSDPKMRSCYVVAAKGQPDVEMLEVDLQKYPEVSRAMETREPVLIDDVESDPLVESVRDVLLEKGYRSILVLPLVFGHEVLGALFLRGDSERSYSDEELRFCKVAAGASANALKNALLYRDVAEESEKQRETGEKLRGILDGSPDMIVATDNVGTIMEFNGGAEALTGRSAERMLGRSLIELIGETAEGNDVVIHTPEGAKVELALVSAPLTGADGEAVGRVWIGRDVTKLRRVEKSLVQAERLSSLGEVVAGVAHELNNPLSGVLGYAELLRPHVTDPDRLRDLELIVQSAERCERIVYNLLSFARKHAPESKSQSLNECVEKVLELKSYHLRSSQIETVLELDADLPRTCFDFHQVEQVVLNLLNNADQAISSIKTPGRIVLRSGVRDGSVFLEVEDNGPGVPTAIRERIFDPFFTTKDYGEGTGLGLSISYGIICEHGGKIEMSQASEEGGTRFTVTLPIVEAPEQAEQADTPLPAAGSERPLQGRQVLVVEDEPMVLELLSRVLAGDGAEVTQARDGHEAWEQIEQRSYDLVVTDMLMPNLNGQQLYERVAEERPEMLRRFVFATGDLVRAETVEFLQGLPNRILTKPLEIETVRRVLNQAVEA